MTTTVTHEPHPTPTALPDGYVEEIDARTLAPGSLVVVETHNSTYWIRLRDTDPRTATIQGGQLFPAETEARVVGANFGGSWLGLGQIRVGLSLELFVEGQRVVTSTVQSIEVHPPTA